MKLHFLGTTGFHPTPRRHTACLMIPELGMVLDAGTGMFRVRELLATDTLDVYLTHAHLDHVVGLTYLLEIFGIEGQSRVTVHAAPKVIAAVREHLFAPALFPVPPGFRFVPLAMDPHTVAGGGTLTAFPLVHPGGALGWRFDWPGHSLAYVTDTTAGPGVDYLANIQGVELLVHESNFPAGHDELAHVTGHSCLDQVVALAAAAQVQQLVLVHSDPLLACDDDFDLTAARSVFANVSWAHDGDVVEF